jgi:hypothetical protein
MSVVDPGRWIREDPLERIREEETAVEEEVLLLLLVLME